MKFDIYTVHYGAPGKLRTMKETWIYKKSNERFPFNPKTGKLIKE